MTQLLHPWSEVSSRRQAKFGKAFKRALQDRFHCVMPNASLKEAVSVVDKLFFISKTKEDVAASLSTAMLQAFERKENKGTVIQLGFFTILSKSSKTVNYTRKILTTRYYSRSTQKPYRLP